MQKQLEALSFLDKRKATKPNLVTDQVPSVSSAPPSSDQIIVPVQQQTPGYMAFFLTTWLIFLAVIAYKNKNLTKNICYLGSSPGLWGETRASKSTRPQ